MFSSRMMTLEVYQTQEFRSINLDFPILATGNEQWLGDGYYFWQDYEFAKWWGETKKITKLNRSYSVFKAYLAINEDNFIDTVFNQEDYYNFVKNVELFAEKYSTKFNKKPTLEEFNDFIIDFNLWTNIKVIRFQDVPENDQLMKVNRYYYKKRIQIRVNEPQIITKFEPYKILTCI